MWNLERSKGGIDETREHITAQYCWSGNMAIFPLDLTRGGRVKYRSDWQNSICVDRKFNIDGNSTTLVWRLWHSVSIFNF